MILNFALLDSDATQLSAMCTIIYMGGLDSVCGCGECFWGEGRGSEERSNVEVLLFPLVFF